VSSQRRRLSLAARGAWARYRLMRAESQPAGPGLPPRDDPDTGTLAVNCVVFSMDRAMQLDACLRSIERNAPYTGRITVVFRGTSERFAGAYRLLEPGANVRLVPQSGDFRRDVVEAIDPSVPLTVFHTDDDVFFRRPPVTPFLPRGYAAVSLRLGENTTFCYPLDREQRLPGTAEDEHMIAWDWTAADGDFGYPLSLDGHILETRLLLQILGRIRFANPHELEESLYVRRDLVPRRMLAFRQSCVVSIPANIVSETHANRASTDAALSPDVLNDRFLAGERIDLDGLDFTGVRGAHCEVPLAFESP